jgi:3-deoxy-D-manno-octulosonate 8-phosphate phosphatase KdsC-like HAD superfamily phosphatase
MDRAEKLILIDFDGTISDGKTYIDRNGEKPFYAVHSRDNSAIAELIFQGFEVTIITANESKIIKEYAKLRKCGYLQTRDKAIPSFAAIGDSNFDIPMLRMAQHKFCPADADEKVKEIEGMIVLPATGGNGVISHMIKHLL